MTAANPSILVVDDEVDTCRNLSDILTDLGYRVAVAHDGPSALELVRRGSYDVALLDLRMPGMDGLTLYREIKKLRADTVALIVSAYASSAVAEEALGAGAWQVVPKPVDFPLDQPLVLVVDDDPDLCASLWDVLRQQGYRVALAHDERTAEEQLHNQSYRVVLIDMKLPIGDGSRVFQLVRRANPEARTVVITGHRSEVDELVRKVVDEGADAICYKPFDIPRLLGMLEQLTRQPPER
jgi:two-component system, NtrC family, response regulator HydG